LDAFFRPQYTDIVLKALLKLSTTSNASSSSEI